MNSTFDLSRYPQWAGKAVVIYDGDCPFCSNYVKFQRLRETLGRVELLDARSAPELVGEFAAAGMSLDDGMVLLLDGKIYYGADCVNRLALLSSGNGLFNKVNASIFRSRYLSNLLYPPMKLGRNITLKLMGRRRLLAK